jgi:hypothetical protein
VQPSRACSNASPDECNKALRKEKFMLFHERKPAKEIARIDVTQVNGSGWWKTLNRYTEDQDSYSAVDHAIRDAEMLKKLDLWQSIEVFNETTGQRAWIHHKGEH